MLSFLQTLHMVTIYSVLDICIHFYVYDFILHGFNQM